jgi:tRNA-specific 2-thiouridylase
VLGEHRGLIHFTVGQRRGLEIGGQAEPLYVVRSSRRRGGSWSARRARSRCARRGCPASTGSARPERRPHRQGPLDGAARAGRFDGETVHFERRNMASRPGQAAVLYDGSRVLGGGWIEETVRRSSRLTPRVAA